MKTIVICSNCPELDEGGMFSLDTCRRYPGSGWTAKLPELAERKGYRVVTGQQALYELRAIQALPSTYYIIQEELNPTARKLIEMGCKPGILMCFESPIYTFDFYNQQLKEIETFPSQILFSLGNEWMTFPNFEINDVVEPMPWADRQFMSVVTSCKFSARGQFPGELQTARMEAINYFYSRGKLSLHGKGWPAGMATEIPDKIRHISGFKFYLCQENLAMPGYLTEKIIDCFVAGTIPVYQGDPQVSDYIPVNAFVDLTAFKNLEELEQYLDSISPEDGMNMIKAGQDWLKYGDGREHEFSRFAERVLGIIDEHVRSEDAASQRDRHAPLEGQSGVPDSVSREPAGIPIRPL